MRKVRCPSCYGQKKIAKVGGLDVKDCTSCEAKGFQFLVPIELSISEGLVDEELLPPALVAHTTPITPINSKKSKKQKEVA